MAAATGRNRKIVSASNEMMNKDPRIALIHATPLAMEPIQSAFARHWPQARCMNLLDDSLSVDRAESGCLTPEMMQRFIDLASYCGRAGCSAILFTCSAFGPAIEAAGHAVGLPTMNPNQAMFDEALAWSAAHGPKVGLIATFEASIASLSAELHEQARQLGQSIDLHTRFVPEAMQDLARGQAQDHHRKIAAAAHSLRDCHIVMLAQFSMAAALPVVQTELACPVLSSPDCAVLALKKTLTDA